MKLLDKITKKEDLTNNDSLSEFDGYDAQQNHKVFEVFYNFLKKIKPKRILEIGTSKGGFTHFLNEACKEENLGTKILTFDIYEYPWYDKFIENGIDLRIDDIFYWDEKQIKKYVVDFIREEGITLVLCDGGDKVTEFEILSKFIKNGDYIMAHDYCEDERVFEEKINNKVWNWHEISEKDIQEYCEKNNLISVDKEIFEDVVWVCKKKVSTSLDIEPAFMNPEYKIEKKIDSEDKSSITLVTGLWNIGRSQLGDGWSRSFDHYLEKFKQLLQVKENLIIFGEKELKTFVYEHRHKENTIFIERDLEWFVNNSYYNKIQQIRKDPNWLNQVGWLSESTQAKLEMYNPLVMSKMFLLHDAKLIDSFDSKYLFWIDAGLTNTVHPGYFTHDKVLKKLESYINKFTFVCFPYETTSEIHGFKYPDINNFADGEVKKVARGGFFGGPKESISEMNNIYYALLNDTLTQGYMGTEESLFSIMTYKYPNKIQYFEIDGNGLFGKFFEGCKNETLKVMSESIISEDDLDTNKVALYVITFNSPNQFKTLIKSMLDYDKDFLDKPVKYLLNNSTDRTTDEEYKKIAEEHNFTIIWPKENLGITGGRQFIANHFDSLDLDFYFFFEDDMFFYSKPGEVCRNGFNRYVKKLYSNSLEIVNKEKFDFLKLNFTEFYGDNSTQWSWYNVPQQFRELHWPNNKKLPTLGLDSNAPKTKFNEIKSFNGIPYAGGEIYLCNWPILLTKKGSYNCYLKTVYASPFEQTLMSHNFQETVKGNLKPGILLITPTEHNRFEHYEASLRKEC